MTAKSSEQEQTVHQRATQQSNFVLKRITEGAKEINKPEPGALKVVTDDLASLFFE
jgi:hypothetical protein